MKYFLIRHPQTVANVAGITDALNGELSNTGKWQVARTVSLLGNETFDRVYTSPALRCRLLANAIGADHGREVIVNHDLRERDYGDLEGMPSPRLFDLGLDKRPNGGESVEDVYRRAGSVIDQLDGDRAVIVSHGLLLKLFVCQVLHMEIDLAVKCFKFSNCSVSLLDGDAERFEYQNLRMHLGRKVQRIHIFGGWACGKTTLAGKLGKRFNIPVYHLDRLKYPDGFKLENPVAARIERLEAITSMSKWITEGAWTDYADSAFKKADILIHCDRSYSSSILLALKREWTRERPEGVSLGRLLAAITAYNYGSGIVSRKTHYRYHDLYRHKTICAGDWIEAASVPEDLWQHGRWSL